MSFKLRWPTEYGLITQPFGVNPQDYKPWGLPGHEGIDFQAPSGSKVFACAPGIVTLVALDGGKDPHSYPYGNQIRISHSTPEGEFTTVYAHLQQAIAAQGQQVNAGEQIGFADNTGNSHGFHLHLTLKKAGATANHETAYPRDIIDPTPYLLPFSASLSATPDLDDLKYQADVTFPDFAPVSAGQQIIKTWQVLNAGTSDWIPGYVLAFAHDEQLGAPPSVPLPATKAGTSTEVSVPLTVPTAPGLYRSTWQAKRTNGDSFGDLIYALLKVASPGQAAPINAIVDLSHWNNTPDLSAAKADGIVGVIHKATEGVQLVDDRYLAVRQLAQNAGVWWGAYHFGLGNNPTQQADFFLNTVKPDAKTLIALDLEGVSYAPSMSLDDAEKFVTHIHDAMGRWPVLYTRKSYMDQITPPGQVTILSQCPLWVASYASFPIVPGRWNNWTFWQYSNGVYGPQPHDVQGIGPCDRSWFNGTQSELGTLWGQTP